MNMYQTILNELFKFMDSNRFKLIDSIENRKTKT